MEKILPTTPKKNELESATWSNYRHHNTVEFLVFVVPSLTTILSKVYSRRTIKTIFLQSCFLDVLSRHSKIMADKGQCRTQAFFPTVELVRAPKY